MTYPTEYTSASARLRAEPRPNPASTGRRLKRNVRVATHRTTIVLEAYVWDCIDSMLEREGASLDEFCERVNQVRNQSSMASAARLVVLTYYRFLSRSISRPLLMVIWNGFTARACYVHRYRQAHLFLCSALQSGALRKMKRVLNSLIRVWHLTTHRSNIIQAIRA